jgi:hypothetical protein
MNLTPLCATGSRNSSSLPSSRAPAGANREGRFCVCLQIPHADTCQIHGRAVERFTRLRLSHRCKTSGKVNCHLELSPSGQLSSTAPNSQVERRQTPCLDRAKMTARAAPDLRTVTLTCVEIQVFASSKMTVFNRRSTVVNGLSDGATGGVLDATSARAGWMLGGTRSNRSPRSRPAPSCWSTTSPGRSRLSSPHVPALAK